MENDLQRELDKWKIEKKKIAFEARWEGSITADEYRIALQEIDMVTL